MRTSSAKAKGRRLQQQVRDAFRKKYNAETPKYCLYCRDIPCREAGATTFQPIIDADIESRQMGGSGTDIVFSPAAKKLIPFDIECKNTETASPWLWMKQAKQNTAPGRMPLVVFSRNHEDTYVMMRFEDLMKL